MPDIVAETLAKAISLEHEGKPDAALKIYEEAIGSGAEEVLLHSNRGLLLDRMGKVELALADFRKANLISPNFRDHYNAGNMLMKLDRFEDALSEFEASLSYRNDYPDCWANKGIAHHALSQLEEARESFDRALQLNPDFAPAHRCLAILHRSLGRDSLAIGHFKKAAEAAPENANAWFEYGCALYKALDGETVSFDPSGPEGQAVNAFDRVIELAPANAGAWGRKIGVLFRLADAAQAADAQASDEAPQLVQLILADLASTLTLAREQFPHDDWFAKRQQDLANFQQDSP
ncbi:tetratricopeptide repeat protein [Pelagicoccus sp. SDUM812003]|uniref:tetratricopeptide repeat protein n=1 Tax=Pelagicoccus sp. SDUM812003 TaxID=3041267 RepID=UPI00280CE222|nr:tetratricopeptide repeat protein [Pelagicoccus sp. SDUM812003]MDQ8201952.1 tetratricopeptide repeat protein [Pelagicoccus sp. SDUM812003]